MREQLKNVQHIQATAGAFAAILGDASVVMWGRADWGGDSSTVQDQLKNVQQIQASTKAFASILVDGSVITWGNEIYGGDSSEVKTSLRTWNMSKPLTQLVPPCWAMGLLSHGATQILAVTV